MSNVLIIGKKPLPIGGVTIHMERLLNGLKNFGFPHCFYDLRFFSLKNLLKKIKSSRLVHLHSSNPVFRLLIVVLCKLLKRKIIITIHGNFGRFGWIRNKVDSLAIYLSDIPILINDQSFQKAILINLQAVKITAFIPPVEIIEKEVISEKLKAQIITINSNYKYVFCTNAYNISFDTYGHEIYGIFELIGVFSQLNDMALIISDPSGAYGQAIQNQKKILPKNVTLISYPHSFIKVIENSYAFIRNTTTDGDSLSVLEGLYLKKHVLATNCVDRPEGVILYKTYNSIDLKNKIIDITENPHMHNNFIPESGLDKLIQLYQKLS